MNSTVDRKYSTENKCNTTNQNVVQQTKSIMVVVRIDPSLNDEIQSLKLSLGTKKDSELLRRLLQIGLLTANYLKDRDLLIFSKPKLTKILNGLNIDEKAELLELLKRDIGV